MVGVEGLSAGPVVDAATRYSQQVAKLTPGQTRDSAQFGDGPTGCLRLGTGPGPREVPVRSAHGRVHLVNLRCLPPTGLGNSERGQVRRGLASQDRRYIIDPEYVNAAETGRRIPARWMSRPARGDFAAALIRHSRHRPLDLTP